MGVVTEGWTVEEIEDIFGMVRGLHAHHLEKDLQFPDFHYKVHQADAGTTGDGVVATVNNEYTVSRRTIKETADGMYEAIGKKIAKSKEVIDELEQMM